ncbi:hypothetical protein HYV79_03370 [Candidatus Woesearchaeota archaeon]|nr:hypothetical protein [Candidatus Woesearchaeota archaeon]
MLKKGVIIALFLVIMPLSYSTQFECFQSASCDCDGVKDLGETKYECLDALSQSEKSFCESADILDVLLVGETHEFDAHKLNLVSYDLNTDAAVFSWNTEQKTIMQSLQTIKFQDNKELLVLELGPIPYEREKNAVLYCANIAPFCGNNRCEQGEHFNELAFCSADCPRPYGACFQNGLCEYFDGEDITNCAKDCETPENTCNSMTVSDRSVRALEQGSKKTIGKLDVVVQEIIPKERKVRFTIGSEEFIKKPHETAIARDGTKVFVYDAGLYQGKALTALCMSEGAGFFCNKNNVCEEKLGETEINCEDDCKPTQADLDFCARSEIKGNFKDGQTITEKVEQKEYTLDVKNIDDVRGQVKVTFNGESATLTRKRIQLFRNNIQAIVDKIIVKELESLAHLCIDVAGIVAPPSEKYSVTIQALDENNKSISNASVILAGKTKLTDDQGKIIFIEEAGNYTASLSKTGFETNLVNIKITRDEVVSVILSAAKAPVAPEQIPLSYKIVVGKRANPSDLFAAQELKKSPLSFVKDPQTNEVLLQVKQEPTASVQSSFAFDTEVNIVVPGTNYVLIGGPCVNTQTSQLLSNPVPCVKGFPPGQARIEVYSAQDNIIVLIAGNTKEDTLVGIKALVDYNGIDLTGKKFVASKDAFGEIFLIKTL